MPSDTSTMLKGKARNLLHNLLESWDKKDNQQPPKPPPKADNPLPNFNNLSISPGKPASPSQASFVGGFNPAYAYPSSPTNNHVSPSSASAPNLSKPTQIAMPTPFDTKPQSLTMQMALRPPGSDLPPPNLSHRPHSNPNPNTLLPPANIRPTISSTSSTPSSTPSKPPRKKPAAPASTSLSASAPSTPVKGRKPRTSVSSVVSASPGGPVTPKPGQEQCAGITKAGKRCTRMVKVKGGGGGPSAFDDDEDEEEEATPRFCHQHSKELMGPTGYYARKNGVWVDFEDWIPGYLQPETQVSLRVEMEKTKSKSDVDGYIYTFEIREPSQHETINLKVGRAVNLVKRIDQWGKQCGSKEQVLRGFYPGTVESDEDENGGSLMKGRVKAGEKGPLCHRLERLIHLELGDLATNAVYLDPQWPNIDTPPPPADDARDAVGSMGPCADCGSIHKEIFEFKRWKKGKNKGKEWEQVVKPVVERWGRFVDLYV